MSRDITSLLCTGASAVLALLMSINLPENVGAASSLTAKDPGVRAGSPSAGAPLSSLSAEQLAYFQDG